MIKRHITMAKERGATNSLRVAILTTILGLAEQMGAAAEALFIAIVVAAVKAKYRYS